jgi:hypothetical protein
MPSLAIRGETSCLPSYGTLRDAVRARGKKLVRVISMPCGKRQEFTSRGRQTKRWLHFPKLGIGSLDRGPHTTANPCLTPESGLAHKAAARSLPMSRSPRRSVTFICAQERHTRPHPSSPSKHLRLQIGRRWRLIEKIMI